MNYTWLLLDADGTLLDYERSEYVALQQTFEQAGCTFLPEYITAYQRINDAIWLDYEQGKITQQKLKVRRFELLLETLSIETYSPVMFSTKYLKNLSECAYLIDGVLDLLDTLYGNYHLALITNGLSVVQRRRLEKSAIDKYLDICIISEEVGFSKPDPRIFEVAFQKMSQPDKDKVLMVGDSLSSDILGGNTYGIDTCWLNSEREPINPDIQPKYQIHSLPELLSIVAI